MYKSCPGHDLAARSGFWCLLFWGGGGGGMFGAPDPGPWFDNVAVNSIMFNSGQEFGFSWFSTWLHPTISTISVCGLKRTSYALCLQRFGRAARARDLEDGI